eukprot:CAMPEP_0168733702 /NCGR_PEP_ID=MMETSP0724-20121128/8430_1 /TAXON_ID=265536 /ORGANISM="Amphiprora sp., Strain CCMP467" /LENGTH=550 /DNA_ID=CAMNT_0008780775 /DNA_START=82 /DNA_END=1735 /DNA_ORIENTATION=+
MASTTTSTQSAGGAGDSENVYRLKLVKFRGRDVNILLQNENGPCPLLAAANALLLHEKVKLPTSAVRNNVASLSDLTNVLANFAMLSGDNDSKAATGHSFLLDELLKIIPKLQYGMDVNPKFTCGITGYEYTQELACFESWHVKLVHGWLCDPTDESMVPLFQALGNKTYNNELIEYVIQGKEADAKLPQLQEELNQLQVQAASAPSIEAEAQLAKLQEQIQSLQSDSARANYIDHFLATTGHQLTQYGLTTLHQDLEESELVVFFRNNHFCTMTKHEGHLYLLVTDLGYANTPMVVWERLDMINGDTEYVNSLFKQPGEISQSGSSLTPEQLAAQAGQNDADYHLALHLSMQPHGDTTINTQSQDALDSEEGKLIAAATEASLREFHGEPTATTATLPTTAPMVTDPNVAPAGAATPAAMDIDQIQSTQESADEMLARQLAQEMAQEQQRQQQQQTPSLETEDERLARELQAQEGEMPSTTDDERLARQLQQQVSSEDEHLARQLQQEENSRRASGAQVVSTQRTTTTAPPTQGAQGSSNDKNGKCIIS